MKSYPSKSGQTRLLRVNLVAYSSIIVILLAFLIPAGEAGIFSYKDENGKTHFTDDLSKIPEEYREDRKGFKKHKEAQKDTGSIPAPSALSPATTPARSGLPNASGEIHVPLIPAGNNFHVDVVLNSTVTARLVLDTGASMISLSKEVAGKLGMHAANVKAKRTFNTANGPKANPVFAIQTVRVGDAQSYLVEADINDSFVDIDGLLGMGFLGDYRFEIDRSKKILILKPSESGEMEWGGKAGSWWKKRFDSYDESIRDYSRGAIQLRKKRDPRATEYKNLAEHYEDVKLKLENLARVSGVPERFR